jgi:starch synthase
VKPSEWKRINLTKDDVDQGARVHHLQAACIRNSYDRTEEEAGRADIFGPAFLRAPTRAGCRIVFHPLSLTEKSDTMEKHRTGRFRCLYAASEVAGFAKTGGLADVAASLPVALTQRGVDAAVVMPLYRSVHAGPVPPQPTNISFSISIGDHRFTGSVWRGVLPDSDVPIYFIAQPELFERDDPARGFGLYQYTLADNSKRDYQDNCTRYTFFCRAILEALPFLDFWPDVLHCNDWQTGLAPVYLREIHSKHGSSDTRSRYQQIRTLFTIHNMAYQGVFWHHDMPLTGLPWRLFNYEQLEFYGRLNFLKAGIVFSDLISTVSPMYAREIQTPYYGCGLHGVLAHRSHDLFGIVNGADYRVWNPATDQHLPARYDARSVAEGKASCKRALQRHFGLAERADVPLFGMVSRLVDQKGLDLIRQSAWELVSQDLQLLVLGVGEPVYHQMLTDLQKQFPQKVGIQLEQNEPLAHLIEAGADVFLMPSQFEPCGLSQIYSLKYGTVPLVRATGGLADTVVDATNGNLEAGTATGFAFLAYTPAALLETARRALDLYRNHPERWRQLQRTAMTQDWSWDHSAAEYQKLYEDLVHGVGTRQHGD